MTKMSRQKEEMWNSNSLVCSHHTTIKIIMHSSVRLPISSRQLMICKKLPMQHAAISTKHFDQFKT